MCIIPLHLRSSCWFRRAHSRPESNPATADVVLSRVNHRLFSLHRPLLCRDAAACLVSLNLPGKRNPWRAVANPQFPSLPRLTGTNQCSETPIFYVLQKHRMRWIQWASLLQMDCTRSAMSVCQAVREKALVGIFSIASRPFDLLLSHFSINFFLREMKIQVSPWHQGCCWCVVLPGAFGCCWGGPWLKEHQGAELGQGDGVFHLGQEDVKEFFGQRKGQKHLSCSFLNSGFHLPIIELFSAAAAELYFAVQQTTAFTD